MLLVNFATLLVGILAFLAAFAALNPAKAKQISCNVAVLFGVYENAKECNKGCQEPKKKEISAPKKKQTLPKRTEKESAFRTNCSEQKLSVFGLGFDYKHLIVTGTVHLLMFLAFKGVELILKKG